MRDPLTDDEVALLRGIAHPDSNIRAVYFDGPVLLDMVAAHEDENLRQPKTPETIQ